MELKRLLIILFVGLVVGLPLTSAQDTWLACDQDHTRLSGVNLSCIGLTVLLAML
jgi:hypothetical protein